MARKVKYTDVTSLLLTEDQRKHLEELQEFYGTSGVGETIRKILDDVYAEHAKVRNYYREKWSAPLFENVED